jgi:hypothetical protein
MTDPEEKDQISNPLSNEPDASNKLKNNNKVEDEDIRIEFEEEPDHTGQIIESVIKNNDTPQKETDVIPEVVSAVVNNTKNNIKPIEEPIKENASHEVISNVVSGIINNLENNIGNGVVETPNVQTETPNKPPIEKIDIEDGDYENPFYVYIIYYNNEQIPVVIGNKTNNQFPIYMINNKESVDRIGYFQFDNEDGLYESETANDKPILMPDKLTHPIFYQNIAEIIKTKSDPNKYSTSSNVNVDQSESTGSPINTWDSIKIDDNNLTYNLNENTTQINNTKLYKHEIPGDGNCFFTAVAQAFYTNGIYTDAVKLRDFLYKNLTDEIKDMYLNFYNECKMGEIKDNDLLFKEYDCNNIRSSFGFKDGEYEKSFEDGFKDFFMSNNCWANEKIIALLSELLKITFLIDNTNTKKSDQIGKYDHYILLEYINGNHYNLILQKTDDDTPTYKGIFTKEELTDDIKTYFSTNI